jgi:hypothetical protein
VYTHKILHPIISKIDYMNCKDYNLMNHFQNVYILIDFHHNEFRAISSSFIGHKLYSKEWTI